MIQRRYALLGEVGAGKTTLFNALLGEYGLACKTQVVEFDQQGGVDTPGEFFSHPRLYHALINTLSDVQIIIYVHAANDPICRLPPGLLAVYGNKPLITVISKSDLPDVDLCAIRMMLRQYGLGEPMLALDCRDAGSVRQLATLLQQYE